MSRASFAAAALLAAVGEAAAATFASGWSPALDSGGVHVETRSQPGSPVAEVRASIVVAAPPERVFAVITDADRFPEFMPYVEEARTVARIDRNRWYVYQRLSPPLANDRDYTLLQESEADPQSGRYTLRWSIANDHGPPPVDGVVRVELCTGSYELERVEGGTRLTYRLLTDPGGSLPAWLAEIANTQSVPALLQAVAARATGRP